MLVDTKKEQTRKEGLNLNVNSQSIKPSATIGQKIGWWSIVCLGFVLFIIPGIVAIFYWISWGNFFRREQFEVEKTVSNIQVNEAKRADTLIKLLEETKTYLKHEKETLLSITSLRSVKNNTVDRQTSEKILSEASMNFQMVFESYPDLKANQIIMNLMTTSNYLETEIAAARRLYNLKASQFNKEIFTYPKLIKADKMNLETFLLYQASQKQRIDVDMSKLNL